MVEKRIVSAVLCCECRMTLKAEDMVFDFAHSYSPPSSLELQNTRPN